MVRNDDAHPSIVPLPVAQTQSSFSISRSQLSISTRKKNIIISDFEYLLKGHLHCLTLVKPCR